MVNKVVVIGGGQAGFSFAEQYRKQDAEANITLLCNEPYLPYQRPPLSKRYVKGELALEKLFLRPQSWYEKKAIQCNTHTLVTQIDTTAACVKTHENEQFDYDVLALATGSSARELPASIGAQLGNVFTLRDIQDADTFTGVIKRGGTLLVIGGGYIGLEAAAVAASAGIHVVVLELSERILQRVACTQTSDFFRTLHTAHGVQINEGVGLNQLIGDNNTVVQAELSNGETLDVSAVVVGIGIVPNIELAKSHDIHVDNGIVVNEFGETSVKGIYACGDCASFEWQGQRIRLESVQNATDQARNAAINASGSTQAAVEAVAYHPMPWFWSEQFDITLQIAGLTTGFDSIVERPGSKPGAKSFFYFKQGKCLGADVVNDPPTYMVLRRLLEKGIDISAQQAADENFELKILQAGTSR